MLDHISCRLSIPFGATTAREVPDPPPNTVASRWHRVAQVMHSGVNGYLGHRPRRLRSLDDALMTHANRRGT